MTAAQPKNSGPISPAAHRILWFLVWTLFALGMLEWFILGANRPVNPRLSGLGARPAAVVAPAPSSLR